MNTGQVRPRIEIPRRRATARAEFDINPTLVGALDFEVLKNFAFDRDELDDRLVPASSGDMAWNAQLSIGHPRDRRSERMEPQRGLPPSRSRFDARPVHRLRFRPRRHRPEGVRHPRQLGSRREFLAHRLVAFGAHHRPCRSRDRHRRTADRCRRLHVRPERGSFEEYRDETTDHRPVARRAGRHSCRAGPGKCGARRLHRRRAGAATDRDAQAA